MTTQDNHVAALREAAKKAVFEFEEILEWHRLEKTPLRKQELESIHTLIGQLQQALSQPPHPQPQAHDDAALAALGWQRISCPVCGADGARAAPEGAKPEREIEQLIRERDQRDEIIDRLCDAVLGSERPEWSSAYGFDDAVADVEGRIDELLQPSVSKAWDRFERASTAQPQAQGWKLVPVEPTPEMLIRGGEQFFDLAGPNLTNDSEKDQDDAASIYRAMLSASPAAPERAKPEQCQECAIQPCATCPDVAAQPPHPQPQAQGELTEYDWSLLQATQDSLREHMSLIAQHRAALENIKYHAEFSGGGDDSAVLRGQLKCILDEIAAITHANQVLEGGGK